MQDWVLVGTCIWASFFTKPNSAEELAVDDLIDAERVALLGPLVAEVLLGCRRKTAQQCGPLGVIEGPRRGAFANDFS
ncbi:MAG: hypothetical protein HUU20_02955 [Pirellulales bacterium]|nr:hypothetical protein [Pirellulales bacterium]